ncbi:MAG TPA: hypothetical protein VFU47_15510, partial [Armatimonadota bacterium]|nr:hypothetical protein [Armatimonadota bacterium]
PAYEPTTRYEARQVEGWKVLVNRRLLTEEKQTGENALRLLQVKLYDVTRAVPPAALEELRKIPIWMEARDRQFPCACYHPSREWLAENGFNPEKAGAVEIASAETFLKWTHEQPSMVLHELAHGYHHRVLGYGNPEVKQAYEHALRSKSYESVLHWDGKNARAYALNNDQEYFAELSEAYFGTNDFYPFVRAELQRHDPEGFRAVERAWTGAAASGAGAGK